MLCSFKEKFSGCHCEWNGMDKKKSEQENPSLLLK